MKSHKKFFDHSKSNCVLRKQAQADGFSNQSSMSFIKKISFSTKTDQKDFAHFEDLSTGTPISELKSKKNIWTAEEDELLEKLVEEYQGRCWKKISNSIPNKTPIQCLHRWNKKLKPGLIKGPWTLEEDRMLINYVSFYGAHNFSECCKFIVGRNNKQCRERWFNVLNPRVIKGEWKLEEDYFIFKLYLTYGGKWIRFTPLFNGIRAENSIKNRFYSTIRRYNTTLKYNFKSFMGLELKIKAIFEILKKELIEKYKFTSDSELLDFDKINFGYNGQLPEIQTEERFNSVKKNLAKQNPLLNNIPTDIEKKSQIADLGTSNFTPYLDCKSEAPKLHKLLYSDALLQSAQSNEMKNQPSLDLFSTEKETSYISKGNNKKIDSAKNKDTISSLNLNELEANINTFCQKPDVKSRSKISSSLFKTVGQPQTSSALVSPIDGKDKIIFNTSKDITDLSTIANDVNNDPQKNSINILMKQLDDLEALVTNTKKQIQDNFCPNDYPLNEDKLSGCVISANDDIANIYSRQQNSNRHQNEFFSPSIPKLDC